MKENLPVINLTLKSVQGRFDAWRQSKGKGHRIPEELWEAAVSLCRQHPVHLVARSLKLHYTTLKERFEAHANSSPQTPAFVSLPFPPPAPIDECVVEIENQLGERMTIRFKSNSGPDLIALGRTFLGRTS